MSNNKMSEKPTYTDRVIKGKDGVYRWKCTLKREQAMIYYRMMIKIGAIIATIPCAVLIFMLILDSNSEDAWNLLWFIPLIYGLVVGLPVLLGRFSLNNTTRSYEMNEESIKHKYALKGGADAVVEFKKVKWAREEGNAIKMKQGITTYTIFAPVEDAEFVKSFIFTRITLP